jgi:three-Cys-motif partner protein
MSASAKADEIVFVDLFSGGGLYSLGYKKEIFAGASLASLHSDLPITQSIFCERDPESFKLLSRRVQRFFPRKNVMMLDSELSQLTDKFRRIINPSKRGHTVAVLCLVDPFNFDMPLTTMDSLASLGFNFLMPFTFPLNDRSNYKHHLTEHPEKLLRFLGLHNFERMSGVQNNLQFYKRIVRIYQNRMLVMGLNVALSVHKAESRLMDVPAYYIGLFTKQFSAKSIQEDANLTGQLQIELYE